ncbi:MAG TPA: pyridoxamine 5'-phosphate oxidase family protein [Candidatus Methylomirabilis sp.]|jgi:uncharacterized protein YhbP (UPF0306 family)
MADGQEALRVEVLAYLRERYSLTLATDGPGGPWAAGLYFASDGLTLYFLSDPASRHCQDIAANPRVAAAIHEDYRDWREIRGIQLEGTADPVTAPADRVRAWELYLAKFPFVRQFRVGDALEIMGRAIRSQFYRIVPSRVLYLDNRKGFSHRDELVLP